jgi:hypothetical protein
MPYCSALASPWCKEKEGGPEANTYYRFLKIINSLQISITLNTILVCELFSFDAVIFRNLMTPQHRLRVFENRVLKRIFGTKRDEVTGE